MADTTPSNELTISGLKDSLNQEGHGESMSTLQGDDGQDNFLSITPPGISIKNLRSFLSATLKELDGAWDILPESLPVDGVRLYTLNFQPKREGYPFELDFTINWIEAHWDMIPGVLALASPSITINITGKASEHDHLRVSGAVSGVVKIKEIPIAIEIELPGGAFKAQLLKKGDPATGNQSNKQSASGLLKSFQVGGTPEQAEVGKGIDVGALTIEDLLVLGSVEARHLLLHLALGEIKLGPGDMAVQLTLDYFGGANSQLSGQIWGQYHIHKKDSTDNPLFTFLLGAAYDGPGQSWRFAGGGRSATEESVPIGELIEVFTGEQDLPQIFDDLSIKYLQLAYETGTGSFEFQCDIDVNASQLFGGEEVTVEMIVEVRLQKVLGAGGQSSYHKTFGGALIFHVAEDLKLEFDLLFDQATEGQGTDTTLIAAYKNELGGDISINDLLHLINLELDIPLTIKLEDAFFIFHKKGDAKANMLFGLDIGGGVDLSALPLVGKVLPKDTRLALQVQPLIATGTKAGTPEAYFSQTELAHLKALIPGGGISLPSTAIKTPVGLGINISLGEDLFFHFDLPLELKADTKERPKDPKPPEKTPDKVSEKIETKQESSGTNPATAGVSPAPAGTDATGIEWINVQKAFGPVQISRIGVQFDKQEKKLWAYLDASLGVGPLTFSLLGLGMGTPIDHLEPEFTLHGIGLDYRAGAIEIGGALLRYVVPAVGETPTYEEYSGLATIKTPAVGLMALGSYAEVAGNKSLFLYAVLHAPIGGPAFFFVTGLAAGFGYNRAIRVPDISQVGEFPLVNAAVGGAGSQVPTDVEGRRNYIQQTMEQLRGSIYPQNGQYFLAAGIRFSSFKLIDSFVLLLVSFGEHFEVDVLGLSTAVIPTPIPGAKEITPLAVIQLALKATFKPEEGFLGVQAQLTSNSFILDRDCHLTGGFAFFTWFDGPHAGDFVLSVGGYHPDFQKPAHYPTVPRLGLNWQVTSELSIKGGIYFALCPHALMAGGRLEATYHSGSTKAWFIMGVDFLMAWKPYHYEARAYVDIGAQYTSHFCGTHTINGHVSAEVQIWGPDFAGHAHIDVTVTTFDIDFGAKTRPRIEPLDWTAFQQSFLPADESKMVHLSVVDGLIKSQSKDKENAVQQINPRDFKLRIDLNMPVKTIKVGEQSLNTAQLYQTVEKGKQVTLPFQQINGVYAQDFTSEHFVPGNFGIAPMAKSSKSIQSELVLYIKRLDNSQDQEGEPVGGDFTYRPVTKAMPTALWGESLQADVNGQRTIKDVLAGLEIAPRPPAEPEHSQWVKKSELQYSTSPVEEGIAFESIQAFQAKDLATDLREHLVSQDTVQQRRELLEALGFDYDRLGISLPSTIAESLVFDPQCGALT